LNTHPKDTALAATEGHTALDGMRPVPSPTDPADALAQQTRQTVLSVPPQASSPEPVTRNTPTPTTVDGKAVNGTPFSLRHPRLTVTLLPNACPDNIQLEYQALPGSLLGGPFSLRPMSKAGVQVVRSDDVQDLHLRYLKNGYVHNPALRLLIDQMGAQLLHGRNRMGILAMHADTAENICRAVLGVMNRLALIRAATEAANPEDTTGLNEPDRQTPPPTGPVALRS